METTTEAARPVAFLDTIDGAVLLRDPERQRLVELLRDRPDSATGLAERLGETRQRLNYHLRALETAGVLELDEERRRGNCTERILRPAADAFVIDPGLAGGVPAPERAGDRASAAFLLSLLARGVQELGKLWSRAGVTGKRLATIGLESSVAIARPADMDAFVEDLRGAIAEVIARHHDPGAGARPFRLVVGAYPGPADAPIDDPTAGGTPALT
ncbi:MAG TPA: winged helix-turn-helix domain-containing protein [Longimicrobiales bacterium]|nr:winged helix-turn-helix domain-containing protein [Longimicrobiales bacterium]